MWRSVEPRNRGLKTVRENHSLAPAKLVTFPLQPGLAPQAAFLRCSAAWNQKLCSTASLKSWFSRTHLKPRPFKAKSVQALNSFAATSLLSGVRGATYSWEVITPTTGASPGLTRVAYLRPHPMSLSTLAWGGCRGREFPRTGAANISAIQSRVKQKRCMEGEVIGHRRAVEKVSQRFMRGCR
jgi:hypothetical protein